MEIDIHTIYLLRTDINDMNVLPDMLSPFITTIRETQYI